MISDFELKFFFSSLIHRGIGYDMSLASSERALPACLPRDWSAPPCRSLVHRCRIFLRRWKPTSLRATSTTKTLLFHQKHHFYATIFARPVKITSRWCKPQIYEEPRSRYLVFLRVCSGGCALRTFLGWRLASVYSMASEWKSLRSCLWSEQASNLVATSSLVL